MYLTMEGDYCLLPQVVPVYYPERQELLLFLENKDNKLIRSVGSYMPIYAPSYLRGENIC
jgi:hypothetical protein